MRPSLSMGPDIGGWLRLSVRKGRPMEGDKGWPRKSKSSTWKKWNNLKLCICKWACFLCKPVSKGMFYPWARHFSFFFHHLQLLSFWQQTLYNEWNSHSLEEIPWLFMILTLGYSMDLIAWASLFKFFSKVWECIGILVILKFRIEWGNTTLF